ncbi:tail assembly protein [Pseudomonas phage phiPMW]|uniref:Tail assembly protein n=1 Tax=Pseudomonas phage phiPMW TaxID=1815582 RepID=A0A1S5R1I6_9CAUD|nr:tail protein [Pseudomonas phage phiPMW]ANA49267.1 tail assembly protein [Pseudomonas phage phiPMW]
MATWIEVKPAGYLKKFGNHKFYVDSPAEAIKAMMFQVKGFKEAFFAAEKKGLRFQVLSDKLQVTHPDMLLMGEPKVVKIVPRQYGRKNGGWGMILAAAAIAAVVLTGGVGGFFVAGTVSGSIATSVAISFALGGITQLMTPAPEGLKTRTDPENKASYAFGGPVNTTAQGQPVPVFYGYREVGGAVISASMTSEDQK